MTWALAYKRAPQAVLRLAAGFHMLPLLHTDLLEAEQTFALSSSTKFISDLAKGFHLCITQYRFAF